MNEPILLTGQHETGCALRLRQLILALVLVLTFEGLARKMAPTELGVPIFLLKDVLILAMSFYVLQMSSIPALDGLWNAYKVVFVLFVPPVIVTLWHDPFLAVFGTKQYLFYPMVAFATFHGFRRSSMEDILLFFRFVSLLIIPTAMLALLELRLPHDHWLNRTVHGDSLEAFQAAEKLRVSSTFSFVAQFCIFLNAQVFIVIVALHDWGKRNMFWKVLLLSLIPCLVLGSFLTGSRGAVAANIGIIIVAGVLAMMKFKVRNVLRVGLVVATLYLVALAVNRFSPDSTAAYTERENGRLIGISSEIQQRIYYSFFTFSHDRNSRTFFGNGLGIMSNGSDTISSYADYWRNHSPWTETDFATTLFEGGFYLAFVWYGFRLYVIILTTRRFLAGITDEYATIGAFIQGFVVVIGLFGTLAIQPPIAIWWWFGVGTILVIWWKCVAPPEDAEPIEPGPALPVKRPRGRSLYAESLHSRK